MLCGPHKIPMSRSFLGGFLYASCGFLQEAMLRAFCCMLMGLLWSNATQAPRKSHTTQSILQKYCSDRCRREKPRPGRSMELKIEMAFVRLLGDGREKRIINCAEVQNVVFSMARRRAEEKEQEERNIVDKRVGLLDAAGQGKEEQGSDDSDEDATEDEDGGVKLPCRTEDGPSTATTTRSKMDGAPRSTGEVWGMYKAKEREMVRRAARRGVAFGFEIGEGRRRGVEAVQGGRTVESSFAKGEWGVRWRE